MIGHISHILEAFRPCFTRTAAYHWFVTVVFGFIVRIDRCGASSFIRWLAIKPNAVYRNALVFPGQILATGHDHAALVANRTTALSPQSTSTADWCSPATVLRSPRKPRRCPA